MKQQKADRRSQRTYRLVSDALIDLLVEKPYDAILVQDILDRAGIGRTTFYTHYFDKKDALERTTEQLLEMFRQQVLASPTGPAILPSLEIFRHVRQHQSVFQALFRHGGVVLWEMAQAMLTNVVEQALTASLAGNQSPVVPLPVMSEYLAGAFFNLLKGWLEAETSYTPEQMDQFFQHLVMPGVWATIEGKRA